MHHYLSFSSQQLAEDEYFQRWVKSEGADAELHEVWLAWLRANADHAEIVDEARNMLLAVYHDRQHFPDDGIKQRTWKRIDETLSLDSQETTQHRSLLQHDEGRTIPLTRRLPVWYKWAAAAVVLMASSTALYFLKETSVEVRQEVSHSNDVAAVGMRVVEAGSQSVTLMLEDGSSVVLQANSKLSYPEHFGKNDRKVSLTGEGFFEVAKDRQRPFFVETKYFTTRVLGTSFSVRVFTEDLQATVSVKTGNVSVFRHHTQAVDSSEVLLAPRQQVTYNVTDQKLTKSSVQDQAPLPTVARYNFEFQDTPIRDVFQILETAYHVEVSYREENFSHCFLNASLTDVPFEEKLRLICKAVGATFAIKGNSIIISGRGC